MHVYQNMNFPIQYDIEQQPAETVSTCCCVPPPTPCAFVCGILASRNELVYLNGWWVMLVGVCDIDM